MFKTFMQFRTEKNKRQEKETAKEEHPQFYSFFTLFTQLQLDMEASRVGQPTAQATGLPFGKLVLSAVLKKQRYLLKGIQAP